jgi:phosphoribosylanthranilate isomerase
MGRQWEWGTMQAPLIQIYEIQEPSEAEIVLEAGVEHVGSVIVSPSDWKDPRLRETIGIVQSAGAVSSLIPLFSELKLICRAIDYYRPDIIHFCEMLPAKIDDWQAIDPIRALQKAVRKAYPSVKIMRSVPIGQPGAAAGIPTLALAKHFEPLSDFFLTDTLLTPPGGLANAQPVQGFVGITGKTCDWHTARELVSQSDIPVILAGGLSPENVEAGIALVKPAGVDSCTATNQVDAQGKPVRFRKDRRRVRRFVRAARQQA